MQASHDRHCGRVRLASVVLPAKHMPQPTHCSFWSAVGSEWLEDEQGDMASERNEREGEGRREPDWSLLG